LDITEKEIPAVRWQHFFIKRISSPEIVFYVPLLLNAIGLMIKKI